MAELITIGEPLVVFASKDLNQSLVQAHDFSKIVGGAELNVMIGATRLGHSTAYISKVGSDPFGEFIQKEIAEHHIDNQYIGEDSEHWTGFYMKELVGQGDPKTFYFRKGSAASHLSKMSIDQIDYSEVKWAHLSGIFPAISKEANETFIYFVHQLIDKGIHTVFDPNLRPALWENERVMIHTINELAKLSEFILPGINEGEILTGSREPEKIADFYLNQSELTHTVIVKLGAKGAFVKTKTGKQFTVPGFKVEEIVDTVGAGDGFAAGLESALLEHQSLEIAVHRACAIGALAVQTPGDNDGYPTRQTLSEFYRKNNYQEDL